MHIVNNCHCIRESHTKTKLILRAKNSFDSNCRSKQQSAFIFGLGIAVDSKFHGTSSGPEKLSLLSVRTRNSVFLNCKIIIGITRFDLGVIES